MQEADEQDTCRICSAPAEPDQPLFHPCKCSGTIRYIHQDCLTTWLAHSKKKNCDVCKHPYSFTKVYASDMPPSLPPVLLVRRLLQHAFLAILFLVRAVAVATIWLGVLPLATVWTWRLYFAIGESTAWWVSNRPRPSVHPGELPYSKIPSPTADPILPPPRTIIGQFTTHPMWLALSADIFTGQIIASLIVLTFVAVFLLREWISQNARPGVFEEEEIPPADNLPAAAGEPPQARQAFQPRAQAPLAPAQPLARAQPLPVPAPAFHFAQPLHLQAQEQPHPNAVPPESQSTINASNYDPAAEIASRRRLREFFLNAKPNVLRISQEELEEIRQGVRHNRNLARSLRLSMDEIDSMPDDDTKAAKAGEIMRNALLEIRQDKSNAALDLQVAMDPDKWDGTTLDKWEANDDDMNTRKQVRKSANALMLESRRLKQRANDARVFFARQEAAQNRNLLLQELTRELPPAIGQEASSSASASGAETSAAGGETSGTDGANPFPAVVLQPFKTDIPFSLRDWNVPPSSYLLPPTPPVRPSLASTGVPFTFSMNVPVPAASPSLASYRAPEEFRPQAEAGPSRVDLGLGYFDAIKARDEAAKDKVDSMLEIDEAARQRESMSSPPPYRATEQMETYEAEQSSSGAHHDDTSDELDSSVSAARRAHIAAQKRRQQMNAAVKYSAFNARRRAEGKRRQIDDYAIGDDSDDDSRDDMDEDLEAEQRRYFRDRDERELESEPSGLNLDMAAFRRDFPDESPEPVDNETDSEGLVVLHNTHRNDREHVEHNDDGSLHGDEEEDEEEMEEEMEEEEEIEEPEGLFDDDQPWEEVEEEDVEADDNLRMPGAEMPDVPLAQDLGMGAGLEGVDEVDGNVEDDMEGALEAIGLRGPVFGVFQNAALMIFVLDTAIGIGIWMPFTIGKTAALLSLDPRRLMQVLHWPIRAMRIITDPIVDMLAYILLDCILPSVLKVLRGFFFLLGFVAWSAIRMVLGNNVATDIANTSSKIIAASTNMTDSITQYAIHFTTSAPTPTAEQATLASNTTMLSSIPDYLGFTEPYFEALGKEVRISATKAQVTWIELALGNGPSNRVFAVSLGYLVAAFLLCIYLNLLTVGNARTAGLAVRNAVRQQLLVLKVAAFIFIELVTFPFGCGIVLDLCTVWMFPEATLQSRIAFFAQAPLTAMFYHWVAGTMFMYSFAVLLSGCRSVMRPGAMWFIKDPQDQNSHPIRDILDRPTLTQLRKICVSGLMYTFVVVCVVASIAGLLMLGSRSLLPFRWKNRDPLSHVPVDLLFLHLVLPHTMHYFRPKRVVKGLATIVWKFLATRLRLTSYFFGGRHPEEEFTPRDWANNLVRVEARALGEGDLEDGGFRRVPATDNLALPRDMRATAAVTADGVPIDEEAKQLMDVQNAEAEKAKKSVKDDYTVVYMPPHFKYRVIAFIVLLWLIAAVLLGAAIALPILIGRSFFGLFAAHDVHDGYALIGGFYLLWACYLSARAVDRLDKRRQRRGGEGPRANLYVLVLKRGLLWAGRMAYMAVGLGIVVPVLLATVVDLYIILPLRFTLDPRMVPRIRIVDEWALGLLYAKIMLHAHQIQPPNRLTRGLTNIIQRGFMHPDPVLATREVIAPLTGGLLGMIILPGAIFRMLQHFFPELPLDNRFVFMHVYPSVFVLAGAVRSAIVLGSSLRAWSQAIRDKEFLVEMRLKNHDPNAPQEPAAAAPVDVARAAPAAVAGVPQPIGPAAAGG